MERQTQWLPYNASHQIHKRYWELLCSHEPFLVDWTELIEKRASYPHANLNREQKIILIGKFTITTYYPTIPLHERFRTEGFIAPELEQELLLFYLKTCQLAENYHLPELITKAAELTLLFPPETERSHLLLEEVKEELRQQVLTEALKPFAYFCKSKQRPEPPKLPEYVPAISSRATYREVAMLVLEEYMREVEEFYQRFEWESRNKFSTRLNMEYLETLALRVFLRVVKGASWNEIAAATNCTRSTACETTQEGIRLLRIQYHSDTE